MSRQEDTDGSVGVAYVSPAWPQAMAANGVVTYTTHLVRALREMGHRPYVIALSQEEGCQDGFVMDASLHRAARSSRERLLDYLGYRLAPRRWKQLRLAASLNSCVSRLVREAGAQVLEMEEAFGVARRLVSRSPIPVVVRLHGPWFLVGPSLGLTPSPASRRRARDEGLAIAAAAAVSAPSEDVIRQVRAHYGLALANAQVIPNPVVPVPASDRWDPARCEQDRILFVGRFDRCKGADTMIDAFGRVAVSCPSSRLTFVGPDRGLIDDAGEQWHIEPFLANKLADPTMRRRVEWLGTQPASQIIELRRRCFVTVVCSRYENFPMVALEAMACGCPLVASDVGGLSEMIQHERNGLLCRPGDPEDLAEKILTLLRNPKLAACLGRQATIDVEQRYHPVVIAKQMLAFYRRVIERAGPTHHGAP